MASLFRSLFKSRRKRSLWRWLGLVALALVLADALYLFIIWPDWDALSRGATPKSAFIESYEELAAEDETLPRLRWRPVSLSSIAPPMRRVVIVSEDGRFYRHEGIDAEAIRDAMEHNWEKGKISHGASTISQQTVKNLFLSGSRDPLRKWHELVLTLSMEQNLRKRRILELYLNVAEFGQGIYGVEAAARYYWGVPARSLTMDQAISLAATLPSPKRHNPKSRTRAFQVRRNRIERHMRELQPKDKPVGPALPQPARLLSA